MPEGSNRIEKPSDAVNSATGGHPVRELGAKQPSCKFSQLLPLERGSGYLSVAVEFLRVKLSRKYLDLSLHFVLAALFYNPVAPDVGRG